MPVSSTSLPPVLSYPSLSQPPQYSMNSGSISPTSSTTCYSSSTSTPLTMIQPNNNIHKKIKKATSHSAIGTSERPHQCNECGKRFKFKSNLFEHKSLHFSQQTYQYVCPFCSKTCRLKGNLKKHLQIHMGTSNQLEQVSL